MLVACSIAKSLKLRHRNSGWTGSARLPAPWAGLHYQMQRMYADCTAYCVYSEYARFFSFALYALVFHFKVLACRRNEWRTGSRLCNRRLESARVYVCLSACLKLWHWHGAPA